MCARRRWREKYLAALYWALMTLTSVGYGDICPEVRSSYGTARLRIATP